MVKEDIVINMKITAGSFFYLNAND
jgi:hypothetical protein